MSSRKDNTVLLPRRTSARSVSHFAGSFYCYFSTKYTFTRDYDLQKNKYFLWAKCVSKTSCHLQEKENKMRLKRPAVLFPAVSHSELRGWLPMPLPGKMEEKARLVFTSRRRGRNVPVLLGDPSVPKKGLEAGEATKTSSGKRWGHWGK